MGSVRIFKSKELIKFLEKLGFTVVRQRGSHAQLKHPDGRMTTVPVHKGRDISPNLLRQIAKDIDMDVKSFNK